MNILNKDDENAKNEFEKEISDLKDWQENQYNPGYYIGTGRVPKPIARLSKFPRVLIAIGILWLIPGFLIIFSQSFNYNNIIGCIFSIIFGGVIIYGGITRLISKRKNESIK